MNKLVLSTIIIIAVIVGGYFLLRGSYQAPTLVVPTPTASVPEEVTPTSAVKEFTVSGSEYSFTPSSVTVTAGERVKITFRNIGRAPHNLVIEGLGVATKTIGGGQTETVEFTAPASGIYPVFCSVPGHRAAGMEGSLIVE